MHMLGRDIKGKFTNIKVGDSVKIVDNFDDKKHDKHVGKIVEVIAIDSGLSRGYLTTKTRDVKCNLCCHIDEVRKVIEEKNVMLNGNHFTNGTTSYKRISIPYTVGYIKNMVMTNDDNGVRLDLNVEQEDSRSTSKDTHKPYAVITQFDTLREICDYVEKLEEVGLPTVKSSVTTTTALYGKHVTINEFEWFDDATQFLTHLNENDMYRNGTVIINKDLQK